MTTKKKLELLMKSHGFELERKSKHLVWRHYQTGAMVTTSATTSDEKRFLKNVERDIRKVTLAAA